MASACPTCAFMNEPDEKFCGGCGASLAGASSADRKYKGHFITGHCGVQRLKAPLGHPPPPRRRPLLAHNAGASPSTQRRPPKAARSKAWQGFAQSGQADQDGPGWRIRGCAARSLRNGRGGKAERLREGDLRQGATYTAAARTSPMSPRWRRLHRKRRPLGKGEQGQWAAGRRPA